MGHTAAPEEVAEGKPVFPDVSPAHRRSQLFSQFVAPHPSPRLPAPYGSAICSARTYFFSHVFIYPVLRSLFLVAVLHPRAVPTTRQQPPNAEGKEAYGNASF